jgi:outer membrane protein OmpA-like peptidoglycan-associated protein
MWVFEGPNLWSRLRERIKGSENKPFFSIIEMPIKFIKINIFLWCWIGLITSCTTGQNFFVLLPDPNGQVGQIAVSNKGGTQILKEARQSVTVTAPEKVPEPPCLMEEKQIKALFGEALNAQPDPPRRFLLYFKKDTSDLTEESDKLVPEILKSIKDRNSKDVSIIGHTDRVGTRELNYRLALDRAKVIMFLLIYQGINPDWIEIASHGEDNPLIKTEDEVSEPRNRRVEVVIR